MARKSLASMVSDALLDEIVAGDIAPGDALPTEAELCAAHDVSRVTVREAIKTLQTQNVVRVQAGRGTFVNPITQWSDLGPILRAASHGAGQAVASMQLVEVRRMIESGAAALAAARRTEHDVERLEEFIERMSQAHTSADLAAFVQADIDFHDVILRATGNIFVGVLFDPLAKVMRVKREQTSAVPRIQANAIEKHREILEAVRAGDPDAARLAMDDHMEQTSRDLQHYIIDEQGDAEQAEQALDTNAP
ncbi:MAG: FadR family transcriptional regulator [Burkholderiaceae bacterium]|nr:FadR family transcriptional regulator [Microbacteriaceae bacterium]